ANQTLEDALINSTFLEPFAEIEQRTEVPLFASFGNSINTADSDPLDCRQAVTNRSGERGESQMALINVRRQQRDSLRPHFLRIAKHLRGVIDFVGQHSGIEVFRIMRLQI